MAKKSGFKNQNKGFTVFKLHIWYSHKYNNFIWDEENINTEELIKQFKESYRLSTTTDEGQDREIKTPLPFIFRTLVREFKLITEDAFEKAQHFLDKLKQ